MTTANEHNSRVGGRSSPSGAASSRQSYQTRHAMRHPSVPARSQEGALASANSSPRALLQSTRPQTPTTNVNARFVSQPPVANLNPGWIDGPAAGSCLVYLTNCSFTINEHLSSQHQPVRKMAFVEGGPYAKAIDACAAAVNSSAARTNIERSLLTALHGSGLALPRQPSHNTVCILGFTADCFVPELLNPRLRNA